MGDPGYPSGRHAVAAAQLATPAMPAIPESEKLPSGTPYPLVDGLPRPPVNTVPYTAAALAAITRGAPFSLDGWRGTPLHAKRTLAR